VTVPLCSSLGISDEDNAREESRKKSREYCQCPQGHLLSVHHGMFSDDDARDGNQKIERAVRSVRGSPCTRIWLCVST
jgi:hypothetical protein